MTHFGEVIGIESAVEGKVELVELVIARRFGRRSGVEVEKLRVVRQP